MVKPSCKRDSGAALLLSLWALFLLAGVVFACTEIASKRATGITTVNSFAGLGTAASAWDDPAEPKNDKGIQWRGACEAVVFDGPARRLFQDKVRPAANASRRPSRRLRYQVAGRVLRNTNHSRLDFSGQGCDKYIHCPKDPWAFP